jgi:hypothetical protein
MRRCDLTGRPVALALTLLVVAAVTGGCGSSDDRPKDPPKDVLLAALPSEQDPPFQLTRKTEHLETTAQVDPAARAAKVTSVQQRGDVTMTVGFLVVGTGTWVRYQFTGAGAARQPKLPDRWLKVDPTKVRQAPGYEDLGVTSVGGFVSAATSVQDKGGGKYTGVIDVTPKSVQDELHTEQLVAELGDQAREIPFTATLGADHHVATFTLDIPASADHPAFQDVYTFTGFGSTPPVSPPAAGEAQDAPPEAYAILNQ